MSVFRLRLFSPTRAESIDDVVSFSARDASGSFGILANAYQRITALSFGMATVKLADGAVEYLALPGGVLHFSSNELQISTTGYVRSKAMAEVTKALDQKMRLEEDNVREIKRSLHRLDEEILKRLSSLGRRPGGP